MNPTQVTDHMRRLMAITPPTVGKFLTMQYAGSTAHGTYVPKTDPDAIDDVDILGVWLPTERQVFGLQNAEHWMQWDEELDIVTYELRKFAKLLLKGNPNVLGMLWSPHVSMYRNVPLWDAWIENRELFLSQRVYESFSGYAHAQLKKLDSPNKAGYMGAKRKELFAQHGYDTKNAAHCVRLLRMGAELFETGELHVDRTNIDAEQLRDIKRGEFSLAEIQQIAEEGFDRLHPFKENSPFPQRPDEKKVEALVMDTIRKGFDLL